MKKNYRCIKCEGEDVDTHGLYCKKGCRELYDDGKHPDIKNVDECTDGCPKCTDTKSKANSEDKQ